MPWTRRGTRSNAIVSETDPGIRVETGSATGRWRVRYPISAEARVSIIIASGGKADILKTNLEGLFTKRATGTSKLSSSTTPRDR